MTPAMFRPLRRIASLFREPKRQPTRKAPRGCLTLQQLDDRIVPAGWDYTTLVQSLGGYPAAGPTHLYVNFDGDGGNVAAFTGNSQDVQEILYRTGEIFSPFNVEVSRINGAGNYDHGNGSTTIFVGGNGTHIDSKGKKFEYSGTPPDDMDIPGISKSSDHRPNSDACDVAYVDPMFGSSSNPATWMNDSDTTISRSIAHEAGHTFGLAHVRTDGMLDPAPLGAGTTNDVMSYTDTNAFFANPAPNLTPTITAYNNSGDGVNRYDSDMQPRWWATKFLGFVTSTKPITTQNSFTLLQTVLGTRPVDGEFHAGDWSTLDPGVWAKEIPQAPNLCTAVPLTSQVSRQGDFNVFRYDTTAFQGQLRADLVPTSSSLVPYLQFYDAGGNRVAWGDSVLNAATGRHEIHTSLPVLPNATYYFVVGGYDGNSQGGFTLTVRGRTPIAHDQSFAVQALGVLRIDAPGLQAADPDPDHNTMTTSLGRPPAHGTLIYLSGNGAFEYIPAGGFVGTDSFTYTERDINGQSNVATVTLSVNPNALWAGSPSYRVVTNQTLTTTLANGLLAGYSDPNGRTPTVILGSVHAAHGTLNLNANGTFSYLPNSGFHGTDTFKYRVTDGAVTSAEGTVILIVGYPPVARDLYYEIPRGTTLSATAANGLVAVNGDTNAAAHLSGPGLAGLTLRSDGSFSLTTTGLVAGNTYSFRYYVSNPDGNSTVATVYITIDEPDPIVWGPGMTGNQHQLL